MKNHCRTTIIALFTLALLSGCTPSASQMTALLEKHPEILTNAIEKNPDKFMTAVQKAAQVAQQKAQENESKEAEARFEGEFKNPLKPEIDPKRGAMGENAAPITIVEYTDFQCPFCSRGYQTLEAVRKLYPNKIKVIVKHLPLPNHSLAKPAAARFEALMLQSTEKAFAFYHDLFTNQGKITEAYLDAAVKKTGADLARVKKDMQGDVVEGVIKADMAEAHKFEFSGTPGFIVNGVSVRGAYPVEMFKSIIDRHLAGNEKK